MTTIRVAGVDPSFRAFGVAIMDLDLESLTMEAVDFHLYETKPEKMKGLKKNQVDMRQAIGLSRSFRSAVAGAELVFSEIPSGAQSARASWTLGICLGLIANSPITPIEVQPRQTKEITGNIEAGKPEMIDWAVDRYPQAPWLRLSGKPEGRILGKNQHIADAVAVVHAGLITNQFKTYRSIRLGGGIKLSAA